MLLAYAVTTAGFGDAMAFMFSFDPSKLGVEGMLDAMGQAFFTLSLGMGAIMAYGAYVPSDAKLTSTVGTIALLDTLVATALVSSCSRSFSPTASNRATGRV